MVLGFLFRVDLSGSGDVKMDAFAALVNEICGIAAAFTVSNCLNDLF